MRKRSDLVCLYISYGMSSGCARKVLYVKQSRATNKSSLSCYLAGCRGKKKIGEVKTGSAVFNSVSSDSEPLKVHSINPWSFSFGYLWILFIILRIIWTQCVYSFCREVSLLCMNERTFIIFSEILWYILIDSLPFTVSEGLFKPDHQMNDIAKIFLCTEKNCILRSLFTNVVKIFEM